MVKVNTMLKTIQIRKETKDRLDAIADGKSYNKLMRELLKDVEVNDDIVQCNYEYSNIHIDEDLLDKLRKCKMHSKESHSDVIERLLDSRKNSND